MGSKRLIKKNIRPFLGKPLYSYTVEQAINAGASQVIISTDIPEILEKKFFNGKIVNLNLQNNNFK
jgi:N-acylneuraminate cytidylyltransferase